MTTLKQGQSINLSTGQVTQSPTRLPAYPLMGHREGLRMNDLVTLASAFWIISIEGGTAHSSPIPGVRPDKTWLQAANA